MKELGFVARARTLGFTEVLHSKNDQQHRDAALAAFKQGDTRILVTTHLLGGRGLNLHLDQERLLVLCLLPLSSWKE